MVNNLTVPSLKQLEINDFNKGGKLSWDTES
jgi:hypothetical protein